MNNLFKILKEQRALLTEYVYDSKTLRFKKADSNFMDRLQHELAEKIRWSQDINIQRDFRLDIAGLFNQDKDLVHYTFHYHFNPDEQTLDIRTITGRLNDTRLDFPIEDGHKAYPSRDIFKALLKEQMERPVQVNRTEKTWRRNI